MNEQYLMHYGVLGMKWGVRRAQKRLNKAKGALARRTKRDKNDISEQEAKDFQADVKLYSRLSRKKNRKALRIAATERRGKEYANAMMKKSWSNKAVRALTNTATVAVGLIAAKTYVDYKIGKVNLGDGTILYRYPNGR